MMQPGRKYSNGSEYRYGFNGQEKSTEITEGLTTAEFWEYDSRIGRRWNIDPKPTVGVSPYGTFSNSPIFNSDPLGDTTVTGAGGTHSVDVDEKTNSLEFYKSNETYSSSGKPVPVQPGQLRSVTNALGRFSARWKTDENGNNSFAGYFNDKNQTIEAAAKEVSDFANSSLGKYLIWATSVWNEHAGTQIYRRNWLQVWV
jgi:RHS repeat-associated protein